MNIKEFDYNLVQDSIAPYPLLNRDTSRLMILEKKKRHIYTKKFFEITGFLEKKDVLVLNDTKVIPARLYGKKETGGLVEVLLLKQVSNESPIWECLIRTSKKTKEGSRIIFPDSVEGNLLEKIDLKRWKIEFSGIKSGFDEFLEQTGNPPLPPYILKRRGDNRGEEIDKERYQTIYASTKGAVAAPTAGLHFTRELLSEIKKVGTGLARITLHVGGGTFFPPRVEEISHHRMESEYYQINTEDAQIINDAKKEGGRVFSVGTTTTRALETSAAGDGTLRQGNGFTNLFIHPGYKFKIIDCLITNFHQPKSTPLILVCAFAGLDFVKKSYQQAIDNNYRFLSYGDGMLII